MADSFKKKEADSGLDWKSVLVEKEHQPAKVKSTVTYSQLESKVSSIDAQIKNLQDEKKVVEAEMAEVKKVAEK